MITLSDIKKWDELQADIRRKNEQATFLYKCTHITAFPHFTPQNNQPIPLRAPPSHPRRPP